MSWRLATNADAAFYYRLITEVDPRWWRFSRGGTAPMDVLAHLSVVSAAAVVLDGAGAPVAGAMLVAAGAQGTGTLEYHALPEPGAEHAAREMAPEVVGAAIAGSGMRRLYFERFSDDPDLLGGLASAFTTEVVMPRFTALDGFVVDRETLVITAEALAAWTESR